MARSINILLTDFVIQGGDTNPSESDEYSISIGGVEQDVDQDNYLENSTVILSIYLTSDTGPLEIGMHSDNISADTHPVCWDGGMLADCSGVGDLWPTPIIESGTMPLTTNDLYDQPTISPNFIYTMGVCEDSAACNEGEEGACEYPDTGYDCDGNCVGDVSVVVMPLMMNVVFVAVVVSLM